MLQNQAILIKKANQIVQEAVLTTIMQENPLPITAEKIKVCDKKHIYYTI